MTSGGPQAGSALASVAATSRGPGRVVDMLDGECGPALPHHLQNLFDHRRGGLGGGPHPRRQHQRAVLDAQQWLDCQRGPQPGGGGPDPTAAAQILQSLHHDEGVHPGHRRGGLCGNGVEGGPASGSPGGRQRDEPDPHPGRTGVDHPHRTAELPSRVLGGTKGARQRRRDMHSHHTVAAAVDQRRAVDRGQLGRTRPGGTDLRTLIQIGRHLVDTVAQIAAVDEDVQRDHPDAPLCQQICRQPRRRVGDHDDRHAISPGCRRTAPRLRRAL